MHNAYELIRKEDLGDLNAAGYVLRHKKSGAHISLIENDDDNKVFYIGFRTPPEDSTGVPHIIEHTVLCGSDKYPLKDPFVELVKGSMNTFLNAMTYPDKTVYPVASCNDQDFKNLMDVYMDAVFHPNIYHDPEIFMQEGWHYELENVEDDITLNGVVYNEMKGAFSSPEDVVQREILNSLFPDTTYSVESGGDPKVIPELTYEAFLDFHRRYYHPCNSYIYLYGNMDMDERLDYLDREYLSHYEKIELDSSIKKQEAFERPKVVDKTYPISSAEDEKDGTYLAYTFVISDALDQELYQAFNVLEYALFSSQGAPVKKALLEKGIGKDIVGSFDTGTLQPMFSVMARGANPEDKQAFVDAIQEVLLHQVVEGIDKKSLLAAINATQFQYREADFGSFPKGLIFGLQCMDSWLYDEDHPFVHMHGIEVLDGLRKKVDTGYFEDLIQTYLLANTHASVLMVEPKKGLVSEDEEALKAKLADYKASLSKQELEDLVEKTKLLKEHQQEPSTKEQLACIPMLKRSDLKREARPIDLEEKEVSGIKVLHHNVFSNGIHYLTLVFDINHLSKEDWTYASFLRHITGLVDTKNYGYADYANAVNIYTGGITTDMNVYTTEDGDIKFTMEVTGKFLYSEVEKAIELMKEQMLYSDFSDEKRLRELIAAQRSKLEARMSAIGNVLAAGRAMSGFSVQALITDSINGIAYYRFIKDLDENFDERKDLLQKKCQDLIHRIFDSSKLLVSTTGNATAFSQVEEFIPAFAAEMYHEAGEDISLKDIALQPKKEGFKDASQVQYVCRAGNFKQAGFSYTGALNILRVALSYDYFWINVRVKGGAYGCRSAFGQSGDTYFVSYRDPNLEKTNEVFENTAKYVADFDADERDMTKYIIGTISEMDTPLTPSQRGSRALTCYMRGTTYEEIQKRRNEVLDATTEDIRGLAPLVQSVLDQGYFCVVGNEDTLSAAADMFDELKNLYE